MTDWIVIQIDFNNVRWDITWHTGQPGCSHVECVAFWFQTVDDRDGRNQHWNDKRQWLAALSSSIVPSVNCLCSLVILLLKTGWDKQDINVSGLCSNICSLSFPADNLSNGFLSAVSMWQTQDKLLLRLDIYIFCFFSFLFCWEENYKNTGFAFWHLPLYLIYTSVDVLTITLHSATLS